MGGLLPLRESGAMPDPQTQLVTCIVEPIYRESVQAMSQFARRRLPKTSNPQPARKKTAATPVEYAATLP